MHDIAYNQHAFAYAIIWLVGALASLAVALRDAHLSHIVARLLGACGLADFSVCVLLGFLARYPGNFVTLAVALISVYIRSQHPHS